ncbi:fluoride efflux transporter FluC [Liquorilactobacillus capillatus]|nr:CrcB family protein [Liquorilactobacillus capillatus]
MKRKWINALSVLFFGFWGGVLRYLFSRLFNFNGTIMVNLIGCFLLAFLTYFFISFKNFAEWLTVGLSTGLVGSFTTFSSFNLDIFKLLLLNKNGYLIFYVSSSILGGLALAFLGSFLGTLIGHRMGAREGGRE